MTRYSVQPKDRIFVKNYWVLSFAKPICKSVGKNKSKNLSGKYSQKKLLIKSKKPQKIRHGIIHKRLQTINLVSKFFYSSWY